MPSVKNLSMLRFFFSKQHIVTVYYSREMELQGFFELALLECIMEDEFIADISD